MNQPAKTIVITGSSDGIGAAASHALHRHGHEVVVIGRSPDKTAAVASQIGADSYVADFSRLDEVRTLAAALDAHYPRIDVLANNAGGTFNDPTKTVDGFERTFQINHLAPFLLTALLMDKLIASRASIIQSASHAARFAPKLDISDLNLDRNFTAVGAYGAAKLENMLFTTELHRRYHEAGVSAACFTPGNVATNFGTDSASSVIKFVVTNPITRRLTLTSPEKGADQLVWLSEAKPDTDWTSGSYYKKRKISKPENRQAGDPTLARRLWERSEQLLGL